MASYPTLAKMKMLWNTWELRSLVLISLLIRIILIVLANVRKHTASRTIRFLIWSCYLLADWFATFALGVLVKSLMTNNTFTDGSVGDESAGIGEDELQAFWAPFLLLHLGGIDNITAFSLEDNELWLRHLVGLLFQSGTAIYIFISTLPEPWLSWVITILMLVGGISKYIERILALVNASRDRFRKSMMTNPDDPTRDPESQARKPENQHEEDDNQVLILKARDFFQIFKRLIVDLILTFDDQKESRSFFMNTSWEKAYKVIEIELEFLYEILYTKAAVVRTWKGWILRFTTIFSITAVSIIFFGFTEKQPFDKIDVAITCVLLSGAIALELWSLARLLFTDWTVAWMMKKNFFNPSITRFVARVVSSERLPNYKTRWSNSMGQYNLIEFCLKDQPSFLGKVRKRIQVKDVFNKHWYRTNKEISKELKKYIFEELRNEKVAWSSPNSPPHFGSSRGQLALERINIDDQLALRTITIEEDHDQSALRTITIEEDHDQSALQIINNEEEGNQEDDEQILKDSIKAEFDESILLWHIATDICYYLDLDRDQSKTSMVFNYQNNSRDISNYMLYLLVSHPSMLPAGIGQIRFGDTCAEAQMFLHQGGRRETKEKEACKRLHELKTQVSTKEVEGDHTSNSVLLEASNLAKSLLRKIPDIEKRWKIISLVWLEILCYAASECRGYFHAQRLSAGGGELLTVVCFIMAHLGKGKQYRIHRGHSRNRLMVKNNV